MARTGRAQPKRPTELVGDPSRDRAGSAVHQVLLRAVLDREQGVDAPVRVGQIQQVEKRRLGQVGRHEAAQRRLEEVASDRRADPRLLEPRRDGPRVPLGRARGGPRGVQRDLPGHLVELPLREREGQHGERTDLRDESGVAARAPLADQEMRALHPRLVGGHAHLAGEAEDRVVPRAEPSAPAIDGRAVGEMVRPDPAAHPVAGLEDDDRLPGLAQPTRRGEAGVSRTDHADVAFHPLGHGVAR